MATALLRGSAATATTRSGNPLWSGAVAPARPYAERPVVHEDWHDAAVRGLFDRLRRPFDRLRAGLQADGAKLVEAVAAYAPAVARMSDQQIAETALTIRKAVRDEGFSLRAASLSFALTSEAAYRTIGVRHFATQIRCGWELLHGRLVEMQTGEGKTLAATLPAAMVALSGYPVHIVTVNDYLAERDCALTAPFFQRLGLSAGAVVEGMGRPERRDAYAKAITYCTNKQLVFDYLRDRCQQDQAATQIGTALRRLRSGGQQAEPLMLRGLYFAIVDEADSIFIDEARTPLVLSGGGGDANAAGRYRLALQQARSLIPGRDYTLDTAAGSVTLLAPGRDKAHETEALGGSSPERVDLLQQALVAEHLLRRDRHYIVADGKVQIVDESTGRVMADRAWERDLHGLVETKEDCAPSPGRETLARITYQNFFCRYLRLAGMTGTAWEAAGEVRSVYGLRVTRIDPRLRNRRETRAPVLCRDQAEKWRHVAQRVTELAGTAGRPVLIGTRSIAASEEISRILHDRGIDHALLNARHPETEAEIVARAGMPGMVTVATNMAGRGTDIKLSDLARQRGGLHVILTEYHESPRIDRQLFGRCARQGDPGSCEAIVALDDETFVRNAGLPTRLVHALADTAAGRSRATLGLLRVLAQTVAEIRARGERRATMAQDRTLQQALAFAGRPE